MFEDEIQGMRNIKNTAESLEKGLNSLQEQAEQVAADQARGILLDELEFAITSAPEFQHPSLSEPLHEYFEKPERILVQEGSIIVNVEDPRAAIEDWVNAQAAVNYNRAKNSKARGWAANPTPAQRAAYWRNRVYGTEKYEPTIEERKQYITLEAPWWYFLEYGTGPFAYPQTRGHFFVQRTKHQVEGTKLVRYQLRELEKQYDYQGGSAIDYAVEATPKEPLVRWSVWYKYRGSQRQHEYYVGSGGFTGRFRYAD